MWWSALGPEGTSSFTFIKKTSDLTTSNNSGSCTVQLLGLKATKENPGRLKPFLLFNPSIGLHVVSRWSKSATVRWVHLPGSIISLTTEKSGAYCTLNRLNLIIFYWNETHSEPPSELLPSSYHFWKQKYIVWWSLHKSYWGIFTQGLKH